jgi:hypothetical protein
MRESNQDTRPETSVKHGRGLPMAISLVSILVASAALFSLALACLTLLYLRQVAGLTWDEMLRAPFQDVTTTVGTGNVIQPVDVAYAFAVGAVELILVVGFRRRRPWAWVGLMTWSSVLLALALGRYVVYASDHARDFVTMATQSLVVLALNAQVVQEAVGIRKGSTGAVPIRVERTAHGAER